MKNSIEKKLTSIENRLKRIERVVIREEHEEQKIASQSQQELEEMKRLEALETEIENQLKQKPLRKISIHDFTRSAIGSMFGILGHYAFFYGIKIAHEISTLRAGLMYIVSFIIGATFLYFTGYRKSKNIKTMILRLGIIYTTSLITVIAVLTLFDFIHWHDWIETFKSVGAVSILAVMGAVAADLLGKEE